MKSKKLIVSIVAAICIVINDMLGSPVSTDAIYSAIGIVVTYLLGQGLSDLGKEKVKEELKCKIYDVLSKCDDGPAPSLEEDNCDCENCSGCKEDEQKEDA